jgi:hypothetical protein
MMTNTTSDYVAIRDTPVREIPSQFRSSFQEVVQAAVNSYFQRFLADKNDVSFNIQGTPLGDVCGDTVPEKYGFVRAPESGEWFVWSATAMNDRVPPYLAFNNVSSLQTSLERLDEAITAREMTQGIATVRSALKNLYAEKDVEQAVADIRAVFKLFEDRIPGVMNSATPNGLRVGFSTDVVVKSYKDVMLGLEARLKNYREGKPLGDLSSFDDVAEGLERKVRNYKEDKAIERSYQNKYSFLLSALQEQTSQPEPTTTITTDIPPNRLSPS